MPSWLFAPSAVSRASTGKHGSASRRLDVRSDSAIVVHGSVAAVQLRDGRNYPVHGYGRLAERIMRFLARHALLGNVFSDANGGKPTGTTSRSVSDKCEHTPLVGRLRRTNSWNSHDR